jgi:hypothetical protein
MMSSAVRLLADHPLAVTDGRALGDGYGMEELVGVIAPLFARERALIRWVALRGALLYLDMLCPDDASMRALLPHMGLRALERGNGLTVRVNDPAGAIDESTTGLVTGLFYSIADRWSRYAQLVEMNVADVNREPRWAVVNASMGLDYIAWTAVAMIRSGAWAAGSMREAPEPVLLEEPGWYVDPLFAKSERFWDGGDWTQQVRALSGRRWVEVEIPLA